MCVCEERERYRQRKKVTERKRERERKNFDEMRRLAALDWLPGRSPAIPYMIRD